MWKYKALTYVCSSWELPQKLEEDAKGWECFSITHAGQDWYCFLKKQVQP
jgi:hypothetical protein